MDLNGMTRNTRGDENGQWVKDIPNMEDLELLVRSLNAPAVISCRSRKERRIKLTDRDRDGNLKPEVSVRVFNETLAESVLLGWNNLRNGDEQVPYSQELALKLLLDPQYQPFQEAVIWAAGVVNRDKSEVTAELAKNSETPSSGN